MFEYCNRSTRHGKISASNYNDNIKTSLKQRHPLQSTMLPILLPRLYPLTLTALGLGLTTSTYLFHTHHQRRLLCEPSSPLGSVSQDYLPTSSSSQTTTKPTKSSNANLIRQLSLGSVLGVAAGAAVSTFSRVLALLFGVGVVIVQVRIRSFRFLRTGREGEGEGEGMVLMIELFSVCGIKGLQYNSCVEDTEIREGDKSKERDKGEPGAEVEFWDDVRTGIDGNLLESNQKLFSRTDNLPEFLILGCLVQINVTASPACSYR